MATRLRSLFLSVVLLIGFALTKSKADNVAPPATKSEPDVLNSSSFPDLNRRSFPPRFLFGVGSASYQYEGAYKKQGKGPNIWDTFTHRYPEKIKDHSNGDVAIDQYHHYKKDVRRVKNTGFDAYRFSISWSRILPNGKRNGGVNWRGVRYYNNIIDELLRRDIKPFVTLFHWDLPQALEDEYGGFLSSRIVNDFQDYAELCFSLFGKRVKYWTTLNEPYSYSNNGYATGTFAPGRCSTWQKNNCTGGDSGTEPYIVTHNLLLAHAATVKLYKTKFQASQKGTIGITIVTHWFVPLSKSKKNKKAALRALDFMYGWFAEPLTSGDYPQRMRDILGKRLPKFTREESKLLAGSMDFLGINYYSGYYASHARKSSYPSYTTDARVSISSERKGIPIGPKGASDWLNVYPRGIQELLLYTRDNYRDPLIYITENGIDEFNNPKLSLAQALIDKNRIDYYNRHLYYVQSAIKLGVKVKGYFLWSLIDNFEWSSGYTVRFGLFYVDYNHRLKRHPKRSAHWFRRFLNNN